MKSLFIYLFTFLSLAGTVAQAQDAPCSGQSTNIAEGSALTLGYNYTITTNGSDVTAVFQLLDPKVGLVAFAQTYNPNFAEVQMAAVGDPAAQTFTATFAGQTAGQPFNIACKFAFAGGLSTTTIIAYVVNTGCGGTSSSSISLPVTFEDGSINYELQDFGGTASQLIIDPTDASNTVVQTVKTAVAELWAGTTVADVSGFSEAIPFAPGSTLMTVRVWSPTAGIPVRLKVEQVGVPSISVETEATTTVANQWETLTFNFANQAPGTAAISFGNTYNKASIFFNFGTPGAVSGENTYYWDDVAFLPGEPVVGIELPVTFEDDEIDYALTDFGGNASSLVADPTDPGNTVAQSIRTAGAEFFAGTTVGGTAGFSSPVPFVPGSTTLSVRVWSPSAGIPVRLKIENSGNPGISVETEVNTTVAGQWETILFNFSNQVSGTAAINFANQYNKASIFFNFGASGAPEQTYYWDDIIFVPGPPAPSLDLPVDFENDDLNYGLVDFAGTASTRITDPTDANNKVVQTVRNAGSAFFAGTVLGEGVGFANPIAFTPESTVLTVRVWSPLAGIQVRLKAEALTNPGIFVETDATTTVAGDWQTMSFDFANQAPGTPAINFASEYEKLVIFFNFGAEGAPEQTYYWDDVQFPSVSCAVDGGTISTASPRLNLCIGDGVQNLVQFTVTGNLGASRFGLVRQSDLGVVATNATGLFNMENYPAGSYFAGHISVNDISQLSGITNVNQLSGCFDLSNQVAVTSVQLDGGTITPNGSLVVCSGNISFSVTGNQGPNFRWALLNQQATLVLAQNTTGVFNVNSLANGTYRVAHIAFGQGVNLNAITPPLVPECVEASNLVTITKVACIGAIVESSPNPTSGASYVTFSVPTDEYTTLEVYDMSGRKIADLFGQNVQSGAEYRLEFNGDGLPNGVYVYRLTTESEVVIEKFMIAR